MASGGDSIYNIQLVHNSGFIVSGPSNSGKTQWTLRLLKNRSELFDVPPRRLIWCHGTELSEVERKDILNAWASSEESSSRSVYFVQGLPESLCPDFKPHDIVIVDDLQSELKNSHLLTNLFTKYAHHTPLTCIYLCQNFFHRSDPDARTRSLSTSYICLTRNVRDKTVVSNLGKQMFPGRNETLVKIYEDATKSKPFSYLFIDLRQETPDILRLRTGIFPGDLQFVYVTAGLPTLQ